MPNKDFFRKLNTLLGGRGNLGKNGEQIALKSKPLRREKKKKPHSSTCPAGKSKSDCEREREREERKYLCVGMFGLR